MVRVWYGNKFAKRAVIHLDLFLEKVFQSKLISKLYEIAYFGLNKFVNIITQKSQIF